MTGSPLADGATSNSPLLSFGFRPCGAGPLPGAILAAIPGGRQRGGEGFFLNTKKLQVPEFV